MAVMCIITIVLKLVYRQRVIVAKSLLVLVSIIELAVPIKRMLRYSWSSSISFYYNDYLGYTFLSISCLAAWFYFQVRSASSLLIYFDVNPSIRHLTYHVYGRTWRATTLLI
jgi:hypothetical protein